MNVIISARQGMGKSEMAMAIAVKHLRAENWDAAKKHTMVVGDDTICSTEEVLLSYMAMQQPKVVIFDSEFVRDPQHLGVAVTAVKRYRCAYNDALLAIYIEQEGTAAVVLQL